MNKSILCFAAGLLLAGTTSMQAAKAKKAAASSTVTLNYSQGFQGPEWEKHEFKLDKNGAIIIFDGTSLEGWRGYGKTYVPQRWVVEDGTLHFIGKKNPAAKDKNGKTKSGGDLIFAHKFANFELEMEWKISEGGNSGILYLAQEVTDKNGKLQPIYISAPECQVLDNERHPDAKLGKDNNRQSSSLYDMIPAKPQNSKPAGQWNKVKICVNHGKVSHFQNDVKVLEYELNTPEWIQLLQESKFSEEKWPLAFDYLSKCGGQIPAGFIGLQDHQDDVWYRNIKIKELK